KRKINHNKILEWKANRGSPENGIKLARGAVLVLLTGSRNGFADFSVGREAVVVADLQSLVGVHGRCSSELEPKTPIQ
ncbi:hypothetical protein MTR67_038342, partial [Solanum verrucosum]